VGKSAQFPLHVWLPDAMEGPTPVSALIHAATMVNAGVYMVARTNPIFTQSPEVMVLIAAIGIFTALLAASIPSPRPTSNASWRTPRSPSSATCSPPWASVRTSRPSST
jgi:hypothetical protein